MQLNTVVLPAPLGPITAVMSPARASNESVSTASRPPKRMLSWSTSSSGGGIGLASPWGKGAGGAAEHGAHGEGGELGDGDVDAQAAAGHLVLAQRLPRAAQRQPAQAQG